MLIKIAKLLFAIAIAMTAFCANAQEASNPQKIIIIDGKFFGKLPDEVATATTPAGIQFFMLSTPDGTKAIGIKMPGPLPSSALRDTISVEQVPEGKELLRRFNEAQARQSGITLSAVGSEPLVKEGDKLPAFSMTDISGRTWTNADVEGKVMVLNIWYTGCGPCRTEMPELSTWKAEMPGVMFFSATYETAEVARPVIEDRKFNWIPIVNDTLFYKYIGNNGYPLTLVIDRDGTVVMAVHGTSGAKRAALKEKIKNLSGFAGIKN